MEEEKIVDAEIIPETTTSTEVPTVDTEISTENLAETPVME